MNTVLEESDLSITIDGAYPYQLFEAYSVGTNAIILNDEDFNKADVNGPNRLCIMRFIYLIGKKQRKSANLLMMR